MKHLLKAAVGVLLTMATYAVGRVATSQAKEANVGRVVSLPAISFLEKLALGYREAAADVCWMQAVQYYGEYRQGGNDLAQFSHYITAVNALDPRYEHAYWFGSTVLATDGHDLDGAFRILRRGIRANPGHAHLPFHAGFLAYAVAGNLNMATQYFGYASTFPEGRDRALRFRAFINSKLGHLEKSYALWDYLYKNSRDKGMREVAAANLKIIAQKIQERNSPAPNP